MSNPDAELIEYSGFVDRDGDRRTLIPICTVDGGTHGEFHEGPSGNHVTDADDGTTAATSPGA